MTMRRRLERIFSVNNRAPVLNNSNDVATATFSAGCFWHVEAEFREAFLDKGLFDSRCVYTGDNNHLYPTYNDLGDHAESVCLWYDPTRLTYASLVDYFFKIHDPTEVNRQGPDIGRQYRSSIWFATAEEKSIATKARDKWNLHYQKQVNGRLCCTKILPVGQIWTAERHHQRSNVEQ